MTRNYGMNVQASLRGDEHPPARYGANTHADLNSFLLPARSILERSHIRQSAIDVGAVIFSALLVCSVAVSFPVALFLLIFCSF